jgi:hypothetical protein
MVTKKSAKTARRRSDPDKLIAARSQLRAHIKAYVAQNPDRSIPQRELSANGRTKEIMAGITSARRIMREVLNAMVNNNELLGHKVGRTLEVAHVRAAEAVEKKAPANGRRKKAGLDSAARLVNNIDLDLVQSTGALRVTLGKYVLTINLVDD